MNGHGHTPSPAPVDRTAGRLDAAIRAHHANPGMTTRRHLLAVQAEHARAFYVETTTSYQARTRAGGRA